MLEHSLKTAPDECCGILLGPSDRHATTVRRAKNVHENPRTEYEIDPQALLNAVETVEAGPLSLVGFYHSHPRGFAAFSETDQDRANWKDAIYLLCSLAPITFLAGRWTGDAFERLPVHASGDDRSR